jgi:predicted amino acid dehydrogenase
MGNEKSTIAGMIFHPPNLEEVDRAVIDLLPSIKKIYFAFSPFLRKQILSIFPSFVFFLIDKIFCKNGKHIAFFGFMLPMLPEQLVTKRKDAIKKILKLVQKAEKKGVGILTLGAFTSIISEQGTEIVAKKKNISVTTGNTYTSALVIYSVENICSKISLDINKSTLTIIGATGDIGSFCAKYFGPKVKNLILCSRSITENNETVVSLQKVNKDIKVINDPHLAVKLADIVICATSSFGSMFYCSDFKPGAIVCDLSVPLNVPKDLLHKRNDVLAYEGGRAKIPDYDMINNRCWKMMFPENSVFGCLAESLILAFANKTINYSIGTGNIEENRICEIYSLGLQYGFGIADFSFCGYKYKSEDFTRLKIFVNGKK